ncbi:MAG: succinyl-diaminopimelate desuccinylase [Pseudomonadota bacterium]
MNHAITDICDPTALTRDLIRRRSVTPLDDGALDIVQAALEQLGFHVERLPFRETGTPDVDNLYARVGTSGRNVCFAGHTDVVPAGDETAWRFGPFDASIDDGVIFGRGAVDMKGAIACFIAAVARSKKTMPDAFEGGSISLLITGDEEGPGTNGMVKLLDWLRSRGEVIDDCIVGEPSNATVVGEAIKVGRRGSINGELVVRGRQGHTAYPDLADNPIPKLACLISALADVKLDDGTTHFAPSRLAFSRISAPNTVTNIIPNEARATFNVRYNDTWTRDELEQHLQDVCGRAADGLQAEFDLSFSGSGGVFLTKPGRLVDTITRAVADVVGAPPRHETGGGTSDARFIKDICPVVEFGLVNATIHKVDEQVPVADLETLTKIYMRFLQSYFAADGAAHNGA